MYRKKEQKTRNELQEESEYYMDSNHDYDDERTVFIKEFDMNELPPQSVEDNNGVKLVVIGKPGCFAPGTRVRMFDGSVKNVEDVKVGDFLMGDDGTKRTVQKLYHDFENMYHIFANKKVIYTVNEKHDMVVINEDDFGESVVEIVSVKEFLKYPGIWGGKVMKCLQLKWEFKETPMSAFEYGRLCARENRNSIDTIYKINSSSVRQELLSGMFEECNDKTKYSQELLKEIDFVCNSLGITMLDGEQFNFIGPCPLSTDKVTYKLTLDVAHRFDSFRIVSAGYGEYYGFELDGNRLFLLESMDVVKNTGKSSIITSIVDSKKHIIPVSQIFSGTEDSNHFYSSKFPGITIFNDIKDLKPLENFVVRQKYAKRYLSNPWAIQIIDDCTDDPKILTKPLFQSYYKNGRHWKMMQILSLQYCLDIKPVIRTNIDYTFILRETNKKNRKSLFENYASCVDNLKDFESLLDQLTTDYCSMVIVNRTQSNDIEDCIRWYKADLDKIRNFKFGCEDFWLFNNQRIIDTYEE